MAENKIFAGPRIRRIRHSLALTQTGMAEELGISPSYLNLIERNQRPLTVQILLKLSSVYKLDLAELRGEAGGMSAALKEVFADPLLADEVPSEQELFEVAEAAPNAGAAVVKLYRAYRESQNRLSDLSTLLAREGRETRQLGTRLPLDEVRDIFETRANHFPTIEEAAESLAERIANGRDFGLALRNWLKREHDISVSRLPVRTMPLWRRRFDRHSMRLFLSERLSPYDQVREMAMEACIKEFGEIFDAELNALQLNSDEARRLARFELARYGAHALMMPYEGFRDAALSEDYDIEMLGARFGVSFEQAANRLTMLQRPGKPGVPFFMIEIDHAGNRFRRAGAQGFPSARFGGQCPKLPIHAAFTVPGQLFVEAVEMPDGAEFLVIARTLDGPRGGFDDTIRRTALMIGCDAGFRDEIVYGKAVAGSKIPPTPVGAACRLCEREACMARAEPPITKPLGLDDMVTGLGAFDFR